MIANRVRTEEKNRRDVTHTGIGAGEKGGEEKLMFVGTRKKLGEVLGVTRSDRIKIYRVRYVVGVSTGILNSPRVARTFRNLSLPSKNPLIYRQPGDAAIFPLLLSFLAILIFFSLSPKYFSLIGF